MSITLTPKLIQEYQDFFSSCTINSDKKSSVTVIHGKIVANRPRYEQVHQATKLPWFVVPMIHSLEGSLNFTHLHNGDPLTVKTVHIPKGRPPGTPPTWADNDVSRLTDGQQVRIKTIQETG